MTTPARTGILLNLKTTLEGVTVVNGFRTTVALVEPYNRGRDDVSVGLRPYLCFGAGRETPVHELANFIKVEMTVVVVGLVTNADWTQRSAALNNLLDDIIAAILADPTRGGNAVSTKFVSCESDEGDPDAGADGGALAVEFTVEYERLTSAS